MSKVAIRAADSALADLEALRLWYAEQGVPEVGEVPLRELMWISLTSNDVTNDPHRGLTRDVIDDMVKFGLAGNWWTPQIERQCSEEVTHDHKETFVHAGIQSRSGWLDS